LGLFFIAAFSALNVFSVIFAGWASNSTYAVLGGIRALAQLIAYELLLGVTFLAVALVAGSAN
jgi:NADH-quinone oxidoreductase subunit H